MNELQLKAIISNSLMIGSPSGDYLGVDMAICLLDADKWPAQVNVTCAKFVALLTQSNKMKDPDYTLGSWRIKIVSLKEMLKRIGEYISDPSNI